MSGVNCGWLDQCSFGHVITQQARASQKASFQVQVTKHEQRGTQFLMAGFQAPQDAIFVPDTLWEEGRQHYIADYPQTPSPQPRTLDSSP